MNITIINYKQYEVWRISFKKNYTNIAVIDMVFNNCQLAAIEGMETVLDFASAIELKRIFKEVTNKPLILIEVHQEYLKKLTSKKSIKIYGVHKFISTNGSERALLIIKRP